MVKPKATTLPSPELTEASFSPELTEASFSPELTEASFSPELTEDPGALTGQDLLNLVRECGEDVPREELIRRAGYTKKIKDGSTRLMFSNFYEALLEAQGTKLGVKTTTSQAKGGRMGHPLSFLTRVHFNGNIMVGRAYVSMLPVHDKGTEFQVVVNPDSNPGGINLVPVNN